MNKDKQLDDYKQYEDDFFFEEIVEDSEVQEVDDGFYEDEFEMEPYLDGYREDFPEEDETNPLVTVGIIVGLIVVAAIICAVLWSVTHRDSQEIYGTSPAVESVDSPVNPDETDNVELAGNVDEISESAENDSDGAVDSEHNLAEGQDSDNIDGVEDADISDENDMDSENPDGTDVAGNETDNAREDITSMEEPISGTMDMAFTEVSETVTSKDITNIRTAPSTQDAYNIIGQLSNGATVTRTGVNADTGWSRIEYEGQTAYAVTQYLTTDLSYTPPVAANNANRVNTLDGRTIIFVDCDDYITPKEYVNLRTEPSTSEGDTTVSTKISGGTVVHRTGMSPDAGWSRVEINGQVLYVVSSYMTAAQQPTQE